ncbi:MAG: hypothetical protein HKN44_07485 [Ilumatobacter sp.]|nr:hypothetical protein [Ilumatobacter sp.]
MDNAVDEVADAVIGNVTVTPGVFRNVRFDAAELAALVTELAAESGVTNPIHIIVNEATPLAKLSAQFDDGGPDATLVIRAESGALENTKQLQTFGRERAAESLGRMLLRARDRMRDDFADAPPDRQLTLAQNAAWDAYCAGRLARAGHRVVPQRWRYNYRNRFGFSDDVDAGFERLWAAEDLGFADVVAEP